MKNHYLIFQRIPPLFAVLIFLLLLSHFQSVAQDLKDVQQGVFRIKVSEQMADQLERTSLSRTSGNILLTGIQSLDAANKQFNVRDMKRVFRQGGKFEEKHRKYGLHRWYQITLDNTTPLSQAIAAFGKIDQIVIAEPIHKKEIVGSRNPNYGPVPLIAPNSSVTLPGTSNDPFLPNQWHYNNTGQTNGTPGADISLLQAWEIQTGTSNVIVAVTDGGIQVTHPDIAANMWVNTNEIPGNGIDDDNNGYIDDINGYGFGDDTGNIAPDNHGTHVGGTVAAVTNNGIGVAGIAGGSGVGDGARLMSCAAFGGVSTGGFEETYVYAADMGAVISQNSWGYTNPGAFDQVVLDAIDYFVAEAGRDENGIQVGPMNGGIVIFAAGNDDTDNQWYPGFYDATLAVSGTTHNDTKAWYSNFGTWVDIAAPGGETTTNSNQGVASTLANNQYGFFQGTSMACPHVSGAAALLVSQFGGPGFNPTLLRDRLLQTTDNIDAFDPPFAGLLGVGRLNVFAALQSDDGIPPDAITDLASSNVGITSITLQWTSPSDAGNGSASYYDIRYSTEPINESNFDSATAVAMPPSPSPSGTLESYTVTGLLGGTTYYFAIKSMDLFGNVSDISNVVEQPTAFPPVVSVSPESIDASLLTAEIVTIPLTITNSGLGSLQYEFTDDQSGFVSVDPKDGTVAPGENVEVGVLLDAHGLLAGTYNHDLVLTSNDPVTPQVIISVTLTVSNNGAPILSIDGSVDFGGVFVGATKPYPFEISNEGSDTLKIYEFTIDNPDFSLVLEGPVSMESPLVIAPISKTTLLLEFSPSSLGVIEGTLSVSTNDPTQSSVEVSLSGSGLEAPVITVTPTSLTESLNTDNNSTQYLTIENAGGSDLEIALEVTDGAAETFASVEKVIEIASAPVSTSASGQKHNTKDGINKSGLVTLKSVQQTAATYSVLIVTPDEDVSDLAAILNGYDDVVADIYPKASLPGITLDDLTPYDLVITSNNTQWLSSGGLDPVAIGDLLADYIDQGGKVISNQFAYSYDAWQMQGRFIDEGYGPFTPSTTDENIVASLGVIVSPVHPVMTGVSFLDYSGFVQNVGLASGSTPLASWDNGELFAAANSNVVALNMLPSLGDGGALQWDGDLPLIYHNAISWLVGPTFVSASPSSAVIAPGASLIVEVTFDAKGLDAGLYESTIQITNNDPVNPLVNVPASLTVLGPEFVIAPESLEEQLPKGGTVTRTLVLSNNGPNDYNYSVSVNTTGALAVSSATVNTNRPALMRSITSTDKAVVTKPTQTKIDMKGSRAVENDQGAGVMMFSRVAQTGIPQYATGFEEFLPGDIDGQDSWAGQYGNWTIESANPSGGSQHMRGLSDGLGLSLAFSPEVAIGSEDLSTASMMVNLSGTGVTWQIIPQSPTAELVVTRIEFGADGIARVLVSDGSFATIPVATPSGYFNLSIEVERATSAFTLFYDGEAVFSGEGFAGDIEQVVILSGMEVAGPTFDLDDLQLIDGGLEEIPPFISVTPISGNLPAGSTVEIDVTFDATGLEFGKYGSQILVNIEDKTTLKVPAVLTVFGDPAIAVTPTVIQTEVAYKESTTETFSIENTGGNSLKFSMQVIGAATDVANIPTSPVSKFKAPTADKRISEKLAVDTKLSKAVKSSEPVLQLLAGIPLMQESFEGASFPPSGWSVVDNEETGVYWSFAADYGEGNYSGTGEAATVSSDAVGTAEFDTELISPVINTDGYKDITIQFSANYQNYANLDFLDLDILVEGSGTWVNVLSWNEDHGAFRGLPGELVTLELDEYLAGATSFQLRWHYYDPNEDDYDWYVQIDDVVVLGQARAWLSVSPASGEVPVGEKAVINANFDADDIDPGFYVAGVLVSSNAPKNPFVGVVASLNVLAPAEIGVEPDSIYQKLMKGETASKTITITNSGVSPLKFAVGNTELPASKLIEKDRIIAGEPRNEKVKTSVKLDGRAAIERTSKVEKSASSVLYTTGFEEFALGDINGQEDWAGQFANWTIESFDPAEGAQHFTGLSDGFGQSLAFSPTVSIGTEPISSAVMMLDLSNAEGATWQVIPQSPTAQLVITRFQLTIDGVLQALVKDSLDNAFFEDIPVAIPDGYFELKIESVRATGEFTIYFDNIPVFTGQGFTGDIEEVAILSLMEVAGPVFNMDNFALYDGQPQSPWLVVSPQSGVIPAGQSMTLDVVLNATDLDKGVYNNVITIKSNDPTQSVIAVPVTLVVDENLAPVLDSLLDTSVVEGEKLVVVFSATDVDDSLVTVTVDGLPEFASLVNTSNGSVTYSFSPEIGDSGDYELTVTAEDGRGLTSTGTMVLSVIPYGVQSFNLIKLTTGEVIQSFTDSLVIDVSDPAYLTYAITAVTNPSTVGSVLFKVDGKIKNYANNAPYLLNPISLVTLDAGEHSLNAQAFTKKKAKGKAAGSLEATIMVVNSAAVTGFEVVSVTGQTLEVLSEGAVVDISQPGFHYINMVANTTGKFGSVKFEVNGRTVMFDSFAPYSLAGDLFGRFFRWNVKPGHYKITATPYSLLFGQGVAGQALTMEFDVVNGISSSSKGGSSLREAGDNTIEGENVDVTLFPVPAHSELHLSVSGELSGPARVQLVNMQGQILFENQITSERLKQLTLQLDELGLARGMYYIKVQTVKSRITRKFIKE